ncbi:MAG: acyl-CoA synthetase (AMP-forming)/AMP-acid ligase II [uncultured archaeon A07HR60]|nr:MAG: acyl-CoA synthetase (AMP-forming)/AMP-acid ligase II [uncultured archaeon A07HR60]
MRIERLLENRVEKTPTKSFLTFPDRQLTYEAVQNASKRYAAALAEFGVTQRDSVGIFLPNCPEFLFVMFANATLDAVTAPSNPDYTATELTHSLRLSEPDLLVTSRNLLDTAKQAAAETSVEQIVTVDDAEGCQNLVTAASSQSPTLSPKSSDSAAVGLHMYTSGTTGRPKAVECTHENWTISAIDFQKRMGFTSEDTLLTALPLFHANAQIYSTLGAAAAGAEVVIREKFSSSNWWDWCREYGITEFNAMGSMLKMLDNVDETDADGDNPVDLVFSAGTPPDLIESFERRFNTRVVEGYSLTEDPLLILNPTDPQKRRIGSIGLPPAEKTVQVVDDTGEQLPAGETGELVMHCPAVMNGYHDQPQQTTDAIVDGWFHTGDYGKIDDDGFVYFIDRKKDIVRRGGENISSYEVEGVIKALDAVAEVAVIPSPDEFYSEVVKAVIRIEPGHDLAPEDVIDRCKPHLAEFKIPRYIEFVEEFPYTPTGKVQKAQLREQPASSDQWDRETDDS